MKIANTYRAQALDITALVGMVAGFGLMVPAAALPGAAFLALPAFLVLLPSLLYGLR